MRASNWLRVALVVMSILGAGSVALAACPDEDGDSYCDVSVLFARFGRNLSLVPRGKIVVAGQMFTDPASGDVFDTLSPITFTMTESVGTTRTFTLQPADCVALDSGNTRCINVTNTIRGLFAPIRNTPNVFRFKLKAARLDIAGAFQPPVTFTITHGAGIKRRGTLDECRNAKKAMICRGL